MNVPYIQPNDGSTTVGWLVYRCSVCGKVAKIDTEFRNYTEGKCGCDDETRIRLCDACTWQMAQWIVESLKARLDNQT